MALGIQDAKERGIEWVNQEYNRLLEDLDRDANYFNVIRIAKEQMEQEGERQAVQEQKLAEVDEMKLPWDIDTDFGTEGVNDIFRMALKEERAKNFKEFNIEFDRIQAEAVEKIRGYEEREAILQRNNAELQEQIREDENTIEKLYNEAKELRAQVTALSADNTALRNENNDLKQRNAEIEQNRTNAARIILERDAEIERLEDQIDEMRRANALGERQAQRVIEVSKNLESVYEAAKQATAAKRQVMVTANIGLYREIQDAHGNKNVVHESELNEVEVVTEFPELPETFAEPEPIGIESTLEESTMVFGGSEAAIESDLVEEASETTSEAAEVTQETAHSEEVGETFEQEVRRRLARIEDTLYPKVYDPETEAA